MLVDESFMPNTSFIENLPNIVKNLKEINITYAPFEQYNNMWIMGDFTEWEPVPLFKNQNCYFTNLVLIKGFKYYFCYTAMDQIVVDFDQPYETNPRNNQTNNFIIVPKDDNSEPHLFDYKLHGINRK